MQIAIDKATLRLINWVNSVQETRETARSGLARPDHNRPAEADFGHDLRPQSGFSWPSAEPVIRTGDGAGGEAEVRQLQYIHKA